MSLFQARYREGNLLRLAYTEPNSLQPDGRPPAMSPLSSPRPYEPLSPASPSAPLLSPPPSPDMVASLPLTTSSPDLRDGRRSYFGHSRGSSATARGSFSPSNLASSRKWSRLKAIVPLALAAVIFAACILSNPNSSVPSRESVQLYASRITNGLRPWTDSLPKSEQGADAAAATPSPTSAASHLVTEADDGADPSNITISAVPKLDPPSAEDRDAKYLGFLPHSGFHNQRIELQNALLLGKALGRIVLIPPVWIGWPVPTRFYPDLRDSWTNIMLSTPQSFNISSLTPDSALNVPIISPSSKDDFPCPDCDADDPVEATRRQEQKAETRARWEALGYEIRPDGYPIVPGLTADDCKSYSHECRFTYRDTFLGWDFLVDLGKARAVGVEIASRWDVREGALLAQLQASADDAYVLEDRQKYDFRFTDELPLSAPLITPNNDTSHWGRDVSIAALRQLSQRVLLVGSLHGSGRVHLAHEPEAQAWASAFARSVAFSNAWLTRPADAIVERLGGAENFVGVHARVGDGSFARHAPVNMERAWRSLVARLQVHSDAADEMWQHVRPADLAAQTTTPELQRASQRERRHGRVKRVHGTAAGAGSVGMASSWAELDGEQDEQDIQEQHDSEHTTVVRMQHGKRGILTDLWRALSGGETPSERLRNLTCRGALHTERRFAAFNTPLYLATDSRSPEADATLAAFFRAFPCTFVLSDFAVPDAVRNGGFVVSSVDTINRLVNELDGVHLGRLFLPFLEAIVAAKAHVTVGTRGSTFSAFASSDLHDAYHS
ncbi:hypothetical protein JCM3774_000210 [Rhodotorula dairenensis]